MRATAPSVRFVEDLVRQPDHTRQSVLDLPSAAGLTPRCPDFLAVTFRCKSFPGFIRRPAVSCVPCESRFRAFDALVYSLLLEDFSSVNLDTTRILSRCKRVRKILCVEIAGSLWKVWKDSEVISEAYSRSDHFTQPWVNSELKITSARRKRERRNCFLFCFAEVFPFS